MHTPSRRKSLSTAFYFLMATVPTTTFASVSMHGTTKESSITLLCRLAHQSESALTGCQIAEIEAADVHQKYAGKRAPRANRAKLSEARVVDNVEVGQLQKEDTAKEDEKLQKAQAKTTRAQAKANKAPQEGIGQGSGWGGWGGQSRRSGRPPPAKVWSRN